jgi:hypothetical protein
MIQSETNNPSMLHLIANDVMTRFSDFVNNNPLLHTVTDTMTVIFLLMTVTVTVVKLLPAPVEISSVDEVPIVDLARAPIVHITVVIIIVPKALIALNAHQALTEIVVLTALEARIALEALTTLLTRVTTLVLTAHIAVLPTTLTLPLFRSRILLFLYHIRNRLSSLSLHLRIHLHPQSRLINCLLHMRPSPLILITRPNDYLLIYMVQQTPYLNFYSPAVRLLKIPLPQLL